jgi:hypothetical protein
MQTENVYIGADDNWFYNHFKQIEGIGLWK